MNENFSKLKNSESGSGDWEVAITVVGFSSLGWRLGGTAEQMAADLTETATVGVLTPICVEKFQHQANASAKLAALNKTSSWDRVSMIEKGAGHRVWK